MGCLGWPWNELIPSLAEFIPGVGAQGVGRPATDHRTGRAAGTWGGSGVLARGLETGVRTGRRNRGGALGYSLSLPCPAPRYYHTLFTHSLPTALRRLADAAPPCADVLMNFLVAAATKLPPIKVPYGRRREEARPPQVRMWGGAGGTGGDGRGVPSHRPTRILPVAGCGGEAGSRRTGSSDASLLPVLGAREPRARAPATARSPGLHQPDGGGIRPHAPGVLPPPSGACTL